MRYKLEPVPAKYCPFNACLKQPSASSLGPESEPPVLTLRAYNSAQCDIQSNHCGYLSSINARLEHPIAISLGPEREASSPSLRCVCVQ